MQDLITATKDSFVQIGKFLRFIFSNIFAVVVRLSKTGFAHVEHVRSNQSINEKTYRIIGTAIMVIFMLIGGFSWEIYLSNTYYISDTMIVSYYSFTILSLILMSVFWILTNTRVSFSRIQALISSIFLGILAGILFDITKVFLELLARDLVDAMQTLIVVALILFFLILRIGFGNFINVIIYDFRLLIAKTYDVLTNFQRFTGLDVIVDGKVIKPSFDFDMSDGLRRGKEVFCTTYLTLKAKPDQVLEVIDKSGIYLQKDEHKRLAAPYKISQTEDCIRLAIDKIDHHIKINFITESLDDNYSKLAINPYEYMEIETRQIGLFASGKNNKTYYLMTSETLALKINVINALADKFIIKSISDDYIPDNGENDE